MAASDLNFSLCFLMGQLEGIGKGAVLLGSPEFLTFQCLTYINHPCPTLFYAWKKPASYLYDVWTCKVP